ncbi:MAG: hypothetical protein IT255_12035, partial [Chitinophagaceae bacterium]|nr:hypothetical protein [Chitinophagaceae bacterium]
MKTRVIILFFSVVVLSALLISACKKNEVVAENFGPYNPTYLSFNIPNGWPVP